MFGIKKRIRNSRQRTHSHIIEWLRPKVSAIGQRFRLAARIRLANQWAMKHPKRTFALVVGSLLFMLVGSIAVDCMKMESNQTKVSAIESVDPVLDGFRAIQSGKSLQRQSLQEIALSGQEVRHSLDSLIALPHKSRTDSIRIVQEYRQLKKIVETLKHNSDEH